MTIRSCLPLLIAALAFALPARAAPVIDTLPESAVELTVSVSDLTRAQDSLALTVPGGRVIGFSTQVELPEAGLIGIRGHSSGSDRLSLFIVGDEILGGDIHASGGRFRLVSHAGRNYWVSAQALPAPQPLVELPLLPRPVNDAKAAPLAPPDGGGIYEIDLLALYTRSFADTFSFPGREIHRWIFLANTYFVNSSVPVRYRLVAIGRYGRTEPLQNPYELADDPDVQAARNRAGADLAIVFEGGRCLGIATLFNGGHMTGADEPPQNVDAERDAFAFAAMTPNCLDWLPAHELGHVLGGGHDVVLGYYSFGGGVLATYWKEYAHGWQCGDAGNGLPYFSIMHYGGAYGGTAGDFFSSPALMLDGQTCGSEGVTGVEATQADNVRSITQAAPYVAAYRAPPDRGPFKSGALRLGALAWPAVLIFFGGWLVRHNAHQHGRRQ